MQMDRFFLKCGPIVPFCQLVEENADLDYMGAETLEKLDPDLSPVADGGSDAGGGEEVGC